MEYERLLLPTEVAQMFSVDARTVLRWHRAGILPGVRTPSGRHRFREADVAALHAGVRLPRRTESGELLDPWPMKRTAKKGHPRG